MNPRPYLLILIVVLVALWSCTFVVDERHQALVLAFGRIEREVKQPGLHFMIPVYNQVRIFDRRLLNLDAEPERFLTNEKKDVIVDSYVRWRIADMAKFYRATNGDQNRAGQLISQTVNSKLRVEFGKRSVQEVVSGERGKIMSIVTKTANDAGKTLGVEVVDVRIKRIDLPAEVSGSVYGRMRAERERVAREFRSRGAEQAERIRADADKERTVIIAEAYRNAQTIRGEGDAKAADVAAKAYSADREFYDFYRSLNAYKSGFAGRNDILVLKPEGEFFKYFANPGDSSPSP